MKNTILTLITLLIASVALGTSKVATREVASNLGANYFERIIKEQNRVRYCKVSERGISISVRPEEKDLNSSLQYVAFTKSIGFDKDSIESIKKLLHSLTPSKEPTKLSNDFSLVSSRFPKSDGMTSYTRYIGLGDFGGGRDLATNQYKKEVVSYYASLTPEDLTTIVEFIDTICDR